MSDTPAVCVWKRSFSERSSRAPNRSRITFAQILRAARYLAISSKKSLCALKKNDRRGTNSSTSSPASTPYCTYSMPSRSVKASSCSAVAPASRMWYPLTEIVFQRGTSFAQNSKMSVMSRIDGRGGKMYSFCAMNSLRMSFWIVPDSVCQLAPCFSATTRYIAKIIGAGELIVIDVVMSASEMPSNSRSMSASDTIETPHFPTSPSDSGSSGSRPISVGRSNATLSPVPPAASSCL